MNSPVAAQAKRHIGQILISQGILTEDQLRIALTEQKSQNIPIGRLLVRLGFVTEAMVRAADAIFTFDEAIHDDLARRFPEARARLHRLGVLVPADGVDIRDPYGGTLDTFRDTYARIRRAVSGRTPSA